MHLYRLRRIEVHGLHQPSRVVGADRQHREIEATKALPDLKEVWAVAGVTGKIGGALSTLQHPAAPVCTIAVEKTAGREVLRWDAV